LSRGTEAKLKLILRHRRGDPPLFAATYAENPALVKALLAHGADIGQSNAKHQSLMEIVNPKSEIYRIIKNHMLTVRACDPFLLGFANFADVVTGRRAQDEDGF
jgi:hypothetical protein